MLRSREATYKQLANGGISVSQTIEYGSRRCEVLYSILPGASAALRERAAKHVRTQQISRLKSEQLEEHRAQLEISARFYERCVPMIADLRSAGLSFASIALRLNERGERTRMGRRWSGTLVREVFLKSRR